MKTFLKSIGVVLAVAVLAAAFVGEASGQPPTVNGLFHGDGDSGRYQPYTTSTGGSVLYSYFDAPNNRLYVALVVSHSVNDLVCSPQNNGAYTQSTGWPNHRSCKRASDSEYASFTLQCAPGSANSWSWRQAMGCSQTAGPPESNWVSNASCPSSTGIWPPSTVASSSFVANVNTYQAAAPATRAWNLYTHGNGIDNWKSPFLASSPNNATLVPGYPTYSTTNGSGLSYDWEWSMVYEWTVNLGVGGTNCGDQPIFFITGESHHSPAKTGGEDDTFPPPSNPIFSDWGDLPNSYGTTAASNGAVHYLKVNAPYLGVDIQSEQNGQPTSDATGDGAEEDGVTVVVNGNWKVGVPQTIEVQVSRAPNGALLGGWFDWNGDGDFADQLEFRFWNVSEGTNTLSVIVAPGFDWQSDDLYARFRLFSGRSATPNGIVLTQADSVGVATDGEVEDYVFTANSLPVTLNAFASELTGAGELTVQWQTASETDNVGFELWGLVRGEWQALGEIVESKAMNSALPQTYEVKLEAPAGLASLQLVDYDSRGRAEQFGPFRLAAEHGEVQPVERVDWRGPRQERAERLQERGFVATGASPGRRVAASGLTAGAERRSDEPSTQPRWKKLERGGAIAAAAGARGPSLVSIRAEGKGGKGNGGDGGGGDASQQTILMNRGAMTHVAVTAAGIQRVTYEALRDGGLDLAGAKSAEIAVTWRGEAVERWIDGSAHFGPGSAIEFVGRPPEGDDALYVDAALYQVSVDRERARDAKSIGKGAAKRVSPSYRRQVAVDRQLSYFPQSPTGDPWIERSVLVRRAATVTFPLPVDGPVLAGESRLHVGLGAVSDMAEKTAADGTPIPEHNVEVWFAGPGTSFVWVASASTSGQQDWTIEAELPAGMLAAGVNQVQLRFTTAYPFSLIVVDGYGVEYPAPYRGPSLDFPADPAAQGYLVEGFDSPAVVVYAEGADGALTRIDSPVSAAGGGYRAEIRTWAADRFWVTDRPHAPEVFTTAAPGDLLVGPADLVVIADSSFIGTPALDDYLAQKWDFRPVVVDVEDVYNGFGFGMAVPGAITDYLAARNTIHPFSHVQLVGTDCYDRMNRVSSCVSFIPLPTAPVGVIRHSPSHNRLVDFDGDGIGDVAVGQFSVRTEAELATIVGKGASWQASGLASSRTALLVAEESDGRHSFAGQIDRLRRRLAWDGAEVLDMANHPAVSTARAALGSSLAGGRALTVFSGHSSPVVWAFRGLLTAGSVATLTNAGLPTLVVPLACETTYDVSPNANVLGHQLLYGGDRGAVAISGAVALASLSDNERMAEHVLTGLEDGLTLGEAVQAGRRALGTAFQTLQDNWMTQGDVTTRMAP